MSYPHMGMDRYLVVKQSRLGEARSLFGCQTVPIGRDKYVIRSVSLFRQISGNRGGRTV